MNTGSAEKPVISFVVYVNKCLSVYHSGFSREYNFLTRSLFRNLSFLFGCGFFVCFLDFICLFDIYRERAQQGEWQTEEVGEASSLPSREPDAELDPRTLGS